MRYELSAALPDHCRGKVSSSLCRKFDASKIEESQSKHCRRYLGKTERMVEGVRDDELPEGFSAAVRFLGPWIDMNGVCVTDTAMRLERAREVWRKVKVKLFMLGVVLRTKARVVQATVIAALLFGAKVRTFSWTDVERYRRFLGGIIRYISFNKATGEGTMRGMQGNTTTTDLRLKAGLEDVQTRGIHWTCCEVPRRQARTSGWFSASAQP